MSEPRWYTDPGESGAPKPGDIVVAEFRCHTHHSTWMGPVVGESSSRAYPDYRFSVRCTAWGAPGQGLDAPCQVRWPSPTELMVYQLDPESSGTRHELWADYG